MEKVTAVRQMTPVTVAICTRDRSEQLRRALRSVFGQSLHAAEVVVVDNAPTDDSTLALVTDEFPSVRYVQEPLPGLNFARNRALAEARHPIVAFMDDDAVARPDWLAATDAVFRGSDRIVVCSGKVEPLALDTEAQRLFEANGGLSRGDLRIHLPLDAEGKRLKGIKAPLIAWSVAAGVGCSMAVRREAVLRLGGFDEALDLGPVLPGGGDLDLLWRVVDAGHQAVYEPKVKVLHEHRRDMDSVIRQIVGHQTALIAFIVKSLTSAPWRGRPPVFLFLLWRLAKAHIRLAKRPLGRDPLPFSVLLRICGGTWRGLGIYLHARASARQLREGMYLPSLHRAFETRARRPGILKGKSI